MLGDMAEQNDLSTDADPTLPIGGDFVTRTEFERQYKVFSGRIQESLSYLGGGGEVRLAKMQDVRFDSEAADGMLLSWSASEGKFIFVDGSGAEAGATNVIKNVVTVTGASYQVQNADYYVGVGTGSQSKPGPCTVTLPANPVKGRVVIIKDESGVSSQYPITVVTPEGRVGKESEIDSAIGEAQLAQDNGSVSLVFNNGWRII